MSQKTKAIVVGVGPEVGLEAALCKRLAEEGLHVFVAGRTPERVEALVRTIRDAGGRASAVPTDMTTNQQPSAARRPMFSAAAPGGRMPSGT